MPRILRIINRFNLGGPIYNASYLTKFLEPDFETLLIGGAKDDFEDSSEFIPVNLGLKPIIIPEMKRSLNPLNDYRAYKKIKNIIKEFKPDIVHTHAAKAGTLGRLAAKHSGVKIIVHTFHGHVFHSYFNPVTTFIYKNIERYLGGISTKIIAISERQKFELSEIHRIANESKFEVIPLGFDLSKFNTDKENKRKKFRMEYNISDDEIAIGIVGRLVPVKNHELFIRSIHFIRERSKKKLRFFIIGDGDRKELLMKKCHELNIDFTIKNENKLLTFTSWIHNIDIAYNGLDIIALTSHNEGTPVSLIEAQASGKPIVSTNVGGISNIVTKNTGLLSEPDDDDSFFNNLLILIENNETRIKMGESGWDQVCDQFHYSRLIKDFKALYTGLLDENL